ncbi:GHMP family kinase ATP-binding protein [Anaerocolumna jejuensis]|uniref:GHMP family kinase ATP-binding protein n=1 Tax=Anaerocolumna jejuensis TaxID=259063 RepID=UPI003F7BE55F
MVITQTPFRMSFFGGGTDFPGFFEEYGGSVISTSFDKYCYVTVRHLPRFFEYSNEITYAKIERINKIDEIEHPAVREAMRYLDMHELRITYEADLPARSGIGSSSSFAIGMLQAFHALKGQYIDKMALAKEAIHLERVLCKESGGVQDQIAASYGGFNRINFTSEGFSVNPVIISNERKELLNGNLMLFFSGFSRISAEISKSQESVTHKKIQELKEMMQLVDEAEKVLTSKCNLNEFGRLLDYTWKIKRGITNKISNNTIDEIYEKACEAGATGGKLLGAGGGGFLLFYVDVEKQENVKKALNNLLYVPFKFENSGSHILYYKPEEE